MFKLSVVMRGPHESIFDGQKYDDRASALYVFDAIRRAAQRGITERGWTAYESAHLLADVSEEMVAGSWESGDPEFPRIMDGESWPLPGESESWRAWRASMGCGCRPATPAEFAATGEYIYPCRYHADKYGTAFQVEVSPSGE